MSNVLEVEHLRVEFRRAGEVVVPVRDVSFAVGEKARVALVGESGCGKSLTALSVARLPPIDRAHLSGNITSRGRVAYIFQNPSEALNPVMRICDQIREAFPQRMSRAAGEQKIIDLLTRTGLADPVRAAHSFPCELSGGQQQRCMIAMALAAEPTLLIADEPTTALDVTTQAQVLDLIDSLATQLGMAVLLITHNLGLVASRTDVVNVMYAGTIVESGPVTEVLANPRHPYTKGLAGAVPRLGAPRDALLQDISGTVPPPNAWPSGCAFHPRCPQAKTVCPLAFPPKIVYNNTTVFCHLYNNTTKGENIHEH